MPVNAPAEYFKAEDRFRNARTKEEKILAMEEMIRLLPRHHGSENAHAQLRSKLARLRKETTRKAAKKQGVAKEGEAQVCFLGYTNSGKSTLLSVLTGARPRIAGNPYTTTKPEIGMMSYRGVKIQIVEIPPAFEPEYMSVARSCDLVALVSKGDDIKQLDALLEDNFIRTAHIIVNPREESAESIKEAIWKALGLIVVYTRKKDASTFPMALKKNARVRDFAGRIHKDFIKNFRFARIRRNNREIQAGMDYTLQDGDIVELYTK